MHGKKSFKSARLAANRRRLSRCQPRLETLEARTVPTVSFKPIGIGGVGTFAGSATPSAAVAGFNVNTDTVDTISNETSLAVNPTNPLNIIGSANDYQIDPVTFAQTVLSTAHVSFDGGQTWTIYKIPSRNYDGTGDPSIAFDATGRAYAAFLGSAPGKYPDVWVTTSTDGGVHWTGSEVISRNITRNDGSGLFNDKEYIAAWGNGNAIVTWTHFNLGPNGSYISSPIYDSVTHDGGAHWSAPQQISGPNIFNQGSDPVVAADGKIYVNFFSGDQAVGPDFRDSEYVVRIDPNTGAALTTPVNIGLVYDGIHDNPINNPSDSRPTLQESQFRVSLPQGNIVADPTNASHLAVCWFDTRNGPATNSNPYLTHTNSDIIVSQSFDGGVTWSAPQALAVINDQFMPWAAYDGTGRLQIGYFDRSYDTTSVFGSSFVGNHLYGYTLASETAPGSLSFTTQQVTTALSNPTNNDAWFRRNFDPNGNFHNASAFIGDYSNIAILGNGGVGAFWTDMRNPSGFPGRATLAGEQSFFGDPVTASPSRLLASQPAVTGHATPARLLSRDSFFAGLASAMRYNSMLLKSSSSNNNPSAPSGDFLVHLAEHLGFDWLDDTAENPLD